MDLKPIKHPPTDINKIRVLYIEDDPLICELFKVSVEALGCSVTIAQNGKDGLSLFAANPYDLVAVDYHLPDMTGIDIARGFLADHAELPILMVTNKGSEKIAIEAMAAGVSNYVIKDDEETYLELIPVIITRLIKEAEQKRNFAEAQERSEKRYKDLISASPICIHEIDLEGKLISMNAAGLKMMGVDEEAEIIGLRYLDLPMPEHRERVSNLMDRALMGEGSKFEFCIRINSEMLYFSSSFEPIKDNNGNVIKLLGMTEEITERKEAEIALKNSDQMLRTAIESIAEGFALFDKDDRLLLVNRNFFRDRPELNNLVKLGMTFEEQATIREELGLRKNAEGKRRMSLSERIARHKNPQGPFRTLQADGRVVQIDEVKTSDGGTAIIRTDVSTIKQVEDSLFQSEQIYQTLIDSSPFAIYFHRNGKIVYANPATASLFGVNSASDLVGRALYTHHPTHLRKRIEERIRVTLETGKSQGLIEQKFTQEDGTIIDVEVQGAPIRYQGERAILVVARNIIERKTAERALSRSERRFRKAIESLDEAFALFDKDGHLLILNHQYKNMHAKISHLIEPGVVYEELVRANIEAGVNLDALGREEEFIRERLILHKNPKGPITRKRYDNTWSLISEYKTPDGDIVHVETDITALQQAQVALQETNDDLERRIDERTSHLETEIAERKKTESALLEAKQEAEFANSIKSEFLANMSHELRTPMNAILGFGQLMEHLPKEELSKKQSEYIGHILDSGNHLLALINDVLDISIIEAGKLELYEEEVRIVPLVTGIFSLLQGRADAERVKLSLVIDDDLFALRADSRRLKQVLINLLANAVKFTPKGGEVIAKCRLEKNNQISFEISDTGIGMTDIEIQKALETFGQVDSTFSRKYEGTGLGLPLAKQLTEVHGGIFQVESMKGKGTTVTVTFPSERFIREPLNLSGESA